MLRRRLDEATLDIITVMLVRNCKLTPADVEVPTLVAVLLILFSIMCLFHPSQPPLSQGTPRQSAASHSLLWCLLGLAFIDLFSV